MQKKRLKISVCIVTYNHANYASDCLSSVLAQSVDADLEILVGDDVSADNTRDIVRRYAEKYPGVVIPVFHQENVGSTRNYQALIERASGDYIAQLDGDDSWLPGKLQAQMDFLEKNHQCSAVFSNAAVINDAGALVAKFNDRPQEQFDLDYLISKGNFLNSSSTMFRANCKQLLAQDRGPILDFHANILLATQGSLGYINRALVLYRLNSATSISDGKRDWLMQMYWKAILQAASSGAGSEALKQCVKGFYRSLIRSAVTRGQWRTAWSLTGRLTKELPLASRKLFLLSLLTLPYYVLKETRRMFGRWLSNGGVDILFDR
jgi:glycosyltransferase involved in cell wall biosynthesis